MSTINLNPTSVSFYYTTSGVNHTWSNPYIGSYGTTTYSAIVNFNMSMYNSAYITNMYLLVACGSITGSSFSFHIHTVLGELQLATATCTSLTNYTAINNSKSQQCTVMYNDGIRVEGVGSNNNMASSCWFRLQFDYDDPGTYNHVVMPFSSITQYLDGVYSSDNTRYIYYYRATGASTLKQTMNFFPLTGFNTSKMLNIKFLAIPETGGTGGTSIYTEYLWVTQPDASLSTRITLSFNNNLVFIIPLTASQINLTVGFYLYVSSSDTNRIIDLQNVRTYLEFDYDGELPGNTKLWVYNSGTWHLGSVFVYNGSTWEPGVPFINDGSSWN